MVITNGVDKGRKGTVKSIRQSDAVLHMTDGRTVVVNTQSLDLAKD